MEQLIKELLVIFVFGISSALVISSLSLFRYFKNWKTNLLILCGIIGICFFCKYMIFSLNPHEKGIHLADEMALTLMYLSSFIVWCIIFYKLYGIVEPFFFQDKNELKKINDDLNEGLFCFQRLLYSPVILGIGLFIGITGAICAILYFTGKFLWNIFTGKDMDDDSNSTEIIKSVYSNYIYNDKQNIDEWLSSKKYVVIQKAWAIHLSQWLGNQNYVMSTSENISRNATETNLISDIDFLEQSLIKNNFKFIRDLTNSNNLKYQWIYVKE